MRKQGTITSFFRPSSAASTNVPRVEKVSGKDGGSGSEKRPRILESSKSSAKSRSPPPPTSSASPTKRLKRDTEQHGSAQAVAVTTSITEATRKSASTKFDLTSSVAPDLSVKPAVQPSTSTEKSHDLGSDIQTELMAVPKIENETGGPPRSFKGRRPRHRVICDDDNEEEEEDGDGDNEHENDFNLKQVSESEKDKFLQKAGDTGVTITKSVQKKVNEDPADSDPNIGDESSIAESEEEEEAEDKHDKNSPSRKVSTPLVSIVVSRLATKRTWKDGAPVPYKFVADAFAKVEEISGRLEIQAILTQVFRDILSSTPSDLVPTIYLCINKLSPAHHGVELGIGESILLKALSQVTGMSVVALKATYKEVGDLGDVAANARTKQKTMFPPPPLTVSKVFTEFKAIAQISGKNTQEAKLGRIIKMIVASSKCEAKYITRALLGKLRIHLADKTVIAALAAAVTLEKERVSTDILLTVDGKKKSKMSRKEEMVEDALKEATIVLNRVYSQLPVWDEIVPKLLEFACVDERLVEACKLIPGVPVSPMLAKPTKAIGEVLERFAESAFTCEFKYDGERAQIHRSEDGSMKIYSRNAEDLTPKYPDLVRDLPKTLHKDFQKASFIIDAEAVAFDIEKKQILPFQELQSRKRKDVNVDDVKVRVCIFAFDLLFFNNESLIGETLRDRRKRLSAGFQEREGQFMFAKGHDSREPEQIMELLNESVKAGCEGLMVKALEGSCSTYEPANRSQNWLKVKKDYLDGCGDSLDLVPIGGYIGRGKRTGIFGAFLLACYDPDSEEYQSICKIGTGFTEADLESFAKFFKDETKERLSTTAKSYYRIPAGEKLAPDVWFEPVQVWEVKCADLSISPQHLAAVGHVDSEKGIALRFPRFLRVREDKKPEDATTAEQVADLYLRQSSIANNS